MKKKTMGQGTTEAKLEILILWLSEGAGSRTEDFILLYTFILLAGIHLADLVYGSPSRS